MNNPSEKRSVSLPVRVLHPITRLIVGGAQENTMYTAYLLDRSHYQVEVLSGSQTGTEGSLIEEVLGRGIKLTIYPHMLRQVNLYHDIFCLILLTRFIRQRKFSIVHTHSSKAGIIGRLAAKMAGTPVIIHTVHGWSFHDHMHPVLRSTYIFLERWIAQFTDKIIVVTRKDIDKGMRNGIGHLDQYRLIRSAIPLDEFDPSQINREAVRTELGIPQGALVLGNVGRFSNQKNPLDWVRIAGMVNNKIPDSRFLLVGDGPLRSEVHSALARENILEKTILTGLRRDIPRMMAAMDVFLITSLWEGLPRVIPQAMGMGLPVVANAVDGSSEAIINGETGYLSPPGSLDETANYCIELLRDTKKRSEMGKKGREYVVNEFDLRQMVAQIDEVYQELMTRKKSA